MPKVLAKITYHAGKSYRMVLPGRPVAKFFLNRTVPCSDPAVIQRCESTAGFSVTRIETKAEKKKKVKKPVVTGTKKKKTTEDKEKKHSSSF